MESGKCVSSSRRWFFRPTVRQFRQFIGTPRPAIEACLFPVDRNRLPAVVCTSVPDQVDERMEEQFQCVEHSPPTALVPEEAGVG